MTTPVVRTRASWDIALSIVFLVLAVITGGLGAILIFFAAAFTDSCPPKTCNQPLGLSEAAIVWSVIVVVGIVAIVLTIVFLTRRRRAWWIALINLAVTAGGSTLAFVLYAEAVSGGAFQFIPGT